MRAHIEGCNAPEKNAPSHTPIWANVDKGLFLRNVAVSMCALTYSANYYVSLNSTLMDCCRQNNFYAIPNFQKLINSRDTHCYRTEIQFLVFFFSESLYRRTWQNDSKTLY